MRGYQQREDREWFRVAWMVSYLLKPHVKKQHQRKLTPEKLLGRRMGTRAKPARTIEEETD